MLQRLFPVGATERRFVCLKHDLMRRSIWLLLQRHQVASFSNYPIQTVVESVLNILHAKLFNFFQETNRAEPCFL